MKKTINWGVLGAAAIATGRTMQAMLEAPSATLLALASRDGEKGRAGAQTFGIASVYTGYADLLADPDIDAVYVPLPNQLHFECSLIFKRQPARVVAALEHDSAFGIDRLSSALLAYGDSHATFTVAWQSGPSGWGTHQQLSVLGGNGWQQLDFPYAHARPTACSIDLGEAGSVGSFPTATFAFEPVNQYPLQVERFSRLLLGHDVPSWPIEDALATLRTIEALFASGRSGGWQALPVKAASGSRPVRQAGILQTRRPSMRSCHTSLYAASMAGSVRLGGRQRRRACSSDGHT